MRLTIRLFLALLLASCSSGPSVVAPESVGLSSRGLQKVRETLDGLVREKRVAGGAALVARRGRVAWQAAVGFRDAASGSPMAVDTLFRICSMTKPVTSVAVLMLRDERKLSLADPLSKFLPEFARARVAVKEGDSFRTVEAEREITIRHLLTHTSGLTYGFFGKPPFAGLYAKAGVSDGLVETEGTIGENCRRLAAAPLLFQPGTAWEYGLSTDVLGRVVEVASGMTLEEFFRRRIFEPLGMRDTGFRVPREGLARLATVYRPGADKTIERQPDGPLALGSSSYSSTYPHAGPGTFFSGGAGLVSTAGDYARFLQMLLNGGEGLLKRESVAEMTSDQIAVLAIAFDAHGDRFGYGFGVVSEAAKDRGLGSPGTYSWGGFYHTYFFVDPRRELIGVVMTQLYPWSHLTLWSDFRRGVYAALLD